VDTGTPVRGTPASKGSPGQGRGRYGRVEGLVSLRKFSRVPSLGGRRPAYSLLTSDPESKEPAAWPGRCDGAAPALSFVLLYVRFGSTDQDPLQNAATKTPQLHPRCRLEYLALAQPTAPDLWFSPGPKILERSV